VLGLPDRYDKRDVWALASKASSMDIEFVDGIRGDEMTAKAVPAGWSDGLSNSTLGCYRGHMNVWRK